MNIEDIKSIPDLKPEEYLPAIFNRQKELMKKYKEIEGMPDWPFDLDSAEHQIWIKDFLWRVVEEIAESYEAHEKKDKLHRAEELADALHFMVELMIVTNIEPKSWNLNSYLYGGRGIAVGFTIQTYFKVCYLAGLVGNTLKNKKWKQTQMSTDIKKFSTLLNEMFLALLNCFFSTGQWDKEIYELYFKKSEVNIFRQKTNY